MEAVAEHELSVVLSSHLVSDLERVCDHMIVLVGSRVQLAGDIDALLATHHRLTGPRRDTRPLPGDLQVISASHTDRQSTFVVRTDAPIYDPAWTVTQAQPGGHRAGLHGPPRRSGAPARPGGGPMIWLTWRQFRVQARVVAGAVVAPCCSSLTDARARRPLARRHLPDAFRSERLAVAVYNAAIVAVCAPAIVGVFWGAPLVARELEAGTHRLVWTSRSRARAGWRPS